MNAANKPSVAAHDPASAAKSKIGEHSARPHRQHSAAAPRTHRAGFPNVEFYAKAEWFNPGGSVKDRAAYSMIREGERSGDLRPGKIILDATSGNTGIAYAMIGAALGYQVKLCLPTSASPERKHILAAYGVEIVYTPGDEGTDGAIRRVREIYEADPDKYFYPDQYSNAANPAAHYTTTAPEIWEQTRGAITHFVAGLGTSGTFVGTTRRLKELNPAIRCISLQPDSGFHGLEGLKHMATAIVPSIYDPTLADEDIAVRTEDAQQIVPPSRARRGHSRRRQFRRGAVGLLGRRAPLARGPARRHRHRIPRFRRKISERAILERRLSGLVAENPRGTRRRKFARTASRPIPHECCGALLGRDGDASREMLDLLPLANRRDDSPRNRFELTPDDVRLAEKTAREKHLELIGWYHSHPDAPARPSEFDREHAWPWYSYIIVSVQNRRAARHHFLAPARRPLRLRFRGD